MGLRENLWDALRTTNSMLTLSSLGRDEALHRRRPGDNGPRSAAHCCSRAPQSQRS